MYSIFNTFTRPKSLNKFCSLRLALEKSLHYSVTNQNSRLDFNDIDDGDSTSVDIESRSPNRHPLMLMGCSNGGFRFAKFHIKGSLAIIDKTVFRWNVNDAKEITAESLSIFQMVYPKIDLIVIGTGEKYEKLPSELSSHFKKIGIGLEVQSTLNACGTFNLVRQHKPGVIGAALIPIKDNSVSVAALNSPKTKLL